MSNSKRHELSPGLVCVYDSAPEHLQPQRHETVIDYTRTQLEGMLMQSASSAHEAGELAEQLHEVADILRVSDSAEAYSTFCSTNMKLADEYVRERPSLVEEYDKARAHILAAVYESNLRSADEEAGVVAKISCSYVSAKALVKDTALDDNDSLRAQTAHLRILHEVSHDYAPAEGYSPAPAILLEQMLRVEGELRFASDVDVYAEAVELTTRVRAEWDFEDKRTARETVMAAHPASQRRKPTIIRIPSGHDSVTEAPSGKDKAQQSARALGRLSENVRAVARKPPRYL